MQDKENENISEVRLREKIRWAINFQTTDYGFRNAEEKKFDAWVEANNPCEETND
jgi:hypothetical protein